MANQKAFYFDATGCVDCKACQIACKDRSSLPVGVMWRRVFQYEGGSWVWQDGVRTPSNVFAYSVSSACNHCQNPVCLQACPAQAISKRDDGIVLIDQDKCIGCRYCEWVCPYGAPQFNEEIGKMTKCDFCYDLQDAGQNPACVDACVMRVLHFGELDELRARFGSEADIEPLPSASITQPALVIKPHKHAEQSGTGTGRIVNLPEEL
jgi:anaerobic dimethyl sulfoxide reductase subunit B (iron-sulfur subunit)